MEARGVGEDSTDHKEGMEEKTGGDGYDRGMGLHSYRKVQRKH